MFNMRVYSRSGTPLGELNKVANVSRSYAVNKSGSLTFDMAISDPKYTEEILAWDNIIIVYSDEIEPWSGFVNDFSQDGDVVHLTAVSIEQRLGRRRTEPHKWVGEHAGSLFRYLVDAANAKEHTGISVGNIFDGGAKYDLEVVADNIYDKLADVMDLCKYEWNLSLITPGSWTLNLSEKLGQDKTSQVCFLYGKDIADKPQYREDRTQFANSITAIGKVPDNADNSSADSWKSRPKATFQDTFSVGKYGLAEDTIEFSDISDTATLMSQARTQVQTRKIPRRTLTININRVRGLWSQFGNGDIVCVYLPFYGFQGLAVPLRILGREVDESKEIMVVTGEVVEGEAALSLSMYAQAHYTADMLGRPLNPGDNPLLEGKTTF